MDHQEMLDQVSGELQNSKIDTNITRWLNMSIEEIADQFVFRHLHKYATVATAVGNPDVVLATDFHWLKTIGVPAVSRPLYPEDEDTLAGIDAKYRTRQGTVTRYYFSGGSSLGLRHVPSAVETIGYGFQKRSTVLVLATDVSDLPRAWHNLVTRKATTLGYDAEGNLEASTLSEGKERKLLRKLGSSVYKRPDTTLVIGSNRTGRRRLAQPMLPTSFPGG